MIFFFLIFGLKCSFLADGCIAKLFKSRFSFTRLLDGISLFFVRLRCESSPRQQCLQCPKKLRSYTYRRWTHWKIFLWRGVVHFYLEFEIFSPKVKFFTDFYYGNNRNFANIFLQIIPHYHIMQLSAFYHQQCTLAILFSSIHNNHKSSSGHCFWASDPLIDGFY